MRNRVGRIEKDLTRALPGEAEKGEHTICHQKKSAISTESGVEPVQKRVIMAFIMLSFSAMRYRHSQVRGGFAIMEPVIAVAVLAIVASSTVAALLSANRYAVSQRYMSSAKALCQERIDEALVAPFSQSNVPAIFGGSWLPSIEQETLTSNEPVSIYIDSETNATVVSGQRGTLVTWYRPEPTRNAFVYVRVKVTVQFWINGRGIGGKPSTEPGAMPYHYEMTTLRSPS
jgi:type II secretory pathway pseudopilin PulG